MSQETKVYEHLKFLGVPANLAGYRYLETVICEALKTPVFSSVTKVLYPAAAKAYNTTAYRVERAIRHAIEYVHSNTDPEIIYKYFGNTTNVTTGKLTNAQFIAGIAECIRMEDKK